MTISALSLESAARTALISNLPELGANHISVLLVLRKELSLHLVECLDLGLKIVVLLGQSVDLGLSFFLERWLVLLSDRAASVVLML